MWTLESVNGILRIIVLREYPHSFPKAVESPDARDAAEGGASRFFGTFDGFRSAYMHV
jgi:hypothetical protein